MIITVGLSEEELRLLIDALSRGMADQVRYGLPKEMIKDCLERLEVLRAMIPDEDFGDV